MRRRTSSSFGKSSKLALLRWVIGYKPKTRVTATVDGVARELFAVRELRSGDLAVIPRGGQHFEDDGAFASIIDERFSVHVSPNTPGTTITRTMRLLDNRVQRFVSFVHGPKEFLLFPIICKRCGDLRYEGYDSNPRGKDHTVSIASEVPPNSTLIYSVLVASTTRPVPDIEPYLKYEISFSRFKLVIYVNYSNLPSVESDDSLYTVTSDVHMDGVAVGPDVAGTGAEPFQDTQIAIFLRDINEQVALRQAQRLTDGASDTASMIAFLRRFVVFTSHPVETAEIIEMLAQPGPGTLPPT